MGSISNPVLKETIQQLLPETQELLCDMIRFPSVSGAEHELMLFLESYFSSKGLTVERCPMDNSLKDDPEYSSPVEGIAYNGRFNLRLKSKQQGAKTILFNAHSDVVPPSPGMLEAWEPSVRQGCVYGRGACDDKGQIALLALTLNALAALGKHVTGTNLIAHIVNEEENGGNGSLAMMRQGESADACIVLEPTEGRVLTSIRGAVWFKISFKGVAGHSGTAGKTVSALLKARDAIGILEQYHADLLKQSRGIAFFDDHPNPMPITFGKLQAGNWPAAAPDSALLEGVLGFLPNRSATQVAEEMHAVLQENGLKKDHDYQLDFMYRHDCSVLEPDHDLPKALVAAIRASGQTPEVGAMTASCDACYYRNGLAIPTCVYGAGTLGVAHSINEHINMNDIASSAEVLVRFILNNP